MQERSLAEQKAKHRRRVLKQKVRRGEVLKLINLGIKRYERERQARRLDRRIIRGLRRIVEPAIDRFRGRTLIEED